MTTPPTGSGGNLPDEEEDLGPPIRELADFTLVPAPGFTRRSRSRIQRIVFTSQMVDLSWFTPIAVVLEYMDVVARWIAGRGRKSAGEKTDE